MKSESVKTIDLSQQLCEHLYDVSCFHWFVSWQNPQSSAFFHQEALGQTSLWITCICYITKGCFEGKVSKAEITGVARDSAGLSEQEFSTKFITHKWVCYVSKVRSQLQPWGFLMTRRNHKTHLICCAECFPFICTLSKCFSVLDLSHSLVP